MIIMKLPVRLFSKIDVFYRNANFSFFFIKMAAFEDHKNVFAKCRRKRSVDTQTTEQRFLKKIVNDLSFENSLY